MKKIINKYTKFYVHSNILCKLGDIVAIKECRPISKKKNVGYWYNVLKKISKYEIMIFIFY